MKRYTISTFTFKTLAEARKQVLEFANNGDLIVGTKIFEVSEVYDTVITKVVVIKKVK